MVRLHMRPTQLVDEQVTDSAIRRMMSEAGDDVGDVIADHPAEPPARPPRRGAVPPFLVGLILGVITAFVGLIVIIPVIGYATWHGYEETINASAFPRHHEGVTATPRPDSSAAMEHDPVI